MSGRIVPAMDSEGNIIYQQTVAEAVYMADGTTTVETQLASIANLVPAPNGVDDTDAIQSALNKKGHIIINKPGTYIVGKLVIDDDTFLDIGNDVTIKKKDGTNNNILNNKGYLNSYRNKNIKVKGGIWDLNKSGNTSPASELQYCGIVLKGIDGLEISDIEQIGNEGKYAVLIADCKNIEIDNVYINNTSDGLHFQPPINNLIIQNIIGYTQDDLISFTMGDYTGLVLGDDGDIENVIVKNIKAETGTAEHIKLVGSGINGTSVFRNMWFDNIRGDTQTFSVCILKDDNGVVNPYLHNTVLENVRFSNINPTMHGSYSYFSIDAAGGDVTIENCTFKQQETLRPIIFSNGTLDKVTIRNIKIIDDSISNNNNFFINVGSSMTVKQMILQDCRISINNSTGHGAIYVTNNGLKNLFIDNSYFDLRVGYLLYYDGSSGDISYVNLSNVVVASSAYIANISTPMVLKQINCDLTYTTKTFFFADGSNLRYISNGSKLLPNLYPSTPTASRLLGIDSRDLDYIGLLANINSPLLGDMVRCSNASEPLGKGLFYYNGTAWVKITG